MRTLEAGRLMPGQRVVVCSASDGRVVLDVDGRDVTVTSSVAGEVYVSV